MSIGPLAANLVAESVRIDDAFQELADRRLEIIRRVDRAPFIPKHAAAKMVKQFQGVKRECGTGQSRLLPRFSFDVLGPWDDFDNEEAKIQRGRMSFTKSRAPLSEFWIQLLIRPV